MSESAMRASCGSYIARRSFAVQLRFFRQRLSDSGNEAESQIRFLRPGYAESECAMACSASSVIVTRASAPTDAASWVYLR